MPERQDSRAWEQFSHHRRQQREVIVLYQHDRVIAARLGKHRTRKTLIDGLVALPVRFAEHRAHVRYVAQRPQTFVGESVVIPLLLLGGEPKSAQRVLVAAGWYANAVECIDGLGVGTAAAVCDP